MKHSIAALVAAFLLFGCASTAKPSSVSFTQENPYSIHGCTVFNADTAVIGRNIHDAPVDQNSAAIIAHMPSGTFYGAGNETGDFRLNLATPTIPRYAVSATSFRNPPITPDDEVPWQSGYFIEPGSDRHFMVLDTATCEYWEAYGMTSAMTAYAGDSWNLSTQLYAPENNPTTVSYIPLMGFTDFGEDAALAHIPHPIGFFMNSAGIDPNHFTGPAAAAESAGTCSGACLMDGDLIRLKESFPCGSYSQAVKEVCWQLKWRGAYLTDDACCYGLRMGLDSSGNDPWTGYAQFASALTIQDFDVLARGTVSPAATSSSLQYMPTTSP